MCQYHYIFNFLNSLNLVKIISNNIHIISNNYLFLYVIIL
jgi:hypothetical protein